MSYEFLEHTADVKFRAEGLTVEEMFVSASEALGEVVRGNIKILESVEKRFEIEGEDWGSLLYNFLEEFLVLLDAENFLVSSVKSIEIFLGEGKKISTRTNADERGHEKEKYRLKCVVVGDDANNYSFTNDVKAVTYSEMKVWNEKNGSRMNVDEHGFEKGKWVCEVVLDV